MRFVFLYLSNETEERETTCMYSIKNFLTSFFRGVVRFDKMKVFPDDLNPVSLILCKNAIFLILSNVKIPSPLARVKMK